ncbi:MAG: alpha/beta hydrolase [Gemmatimonadota bacterium]
MTAGLSARPARARGAWKLIAVGAVLVVLLGPRVKVEETVEGVAAPVEPRELADWLAAREARIPDIRPGDAKGVVWADPGAPGVTEWAVVYLHGFSADRHEISPAMERVAEGLRANLFFTRLTGHGRGPDAMAEASVQAWLQDAVEAAAVGRRLGRRVLLTGTSTGATLAVWAAARGLLDPDTDALVLISPNFQPRNRASRLLLLPWGGLLARIVEGRERCFEPTGEAQERHWTPCYPSRALLPMMALVERVRTLDLEDIRTPTLVLYSPKDRVVSAAETERMSARLGSNPIEVVPLAQAGGRDRHVLAGDILSPATTTTVVNLILDFVGKL